MYDLYKIDLIFVEVNLYLKNSYWFLIGLILLYICLRNIQFRIIFYVFKRICNDPDNNWKKDNNWESINYIFVILFHLNINFTYIVFKVYLYTYKITYKLVIYTVAISTQLGVDLKDQKLLTHFFLIY